jgi:hypothetical protein
MTEQERELDLQLGDALTKISLLNEIIKVAGDIVKFVEQGKQGEAFQQVQFYHAKIEKLRQWETKRIDMEGRC